MADIRFHDCIRGSGALQRGYYRKTVNNITYPQHRLSYVRKYGPIDSWLVIHHECLNKWCINAEHLKPMTRSQHQAIHANIVSRQYYDELKTCKLGHPLDGENKQQRFCKTCRISAWRKYNSKGTTKEYWRKRYLAKKENTNV